MRPWYMVPAEGFGLGRLPLAPGTWGSLGGLVSGGLGLYYLPFWLCLVAVIGCLVLSIPLCDRASLYMGQQDPPNVVLDEIVGQWIALGPSVFLWDSFLVGTLVAFFVFRFFDIVNVYPANELENLPGGWGIVLDDLMSGLYAQLTLYLLGSYYF